MDINDIKAIRAHALQSKLLVLTEVAAQPLLELIGPLPDDVVTVTLTNYASPRPQDAAKTGRSTNDPDYPLPGGPGPSRDVQAIRARMATLAAEMAAMQAAQSQRLL